MDNKRLSEFTHNCLVTATQVAIVEQAEKTLGLIEKLDEVFLYLVRDIKNVTLYKEMQIVENYVAIQKVRYGNRLNFYFINDQSFKKIHLTHKSIIDYFDSILTSSLEKFEGIINFTLEFDLIKNDCLIIVLESTDSKEIFYKNISLE